MFEAGGDKAFRYSTLYSVGMKSGNPCQASRGHSTKFHGFHSRLQNSGFEFADVGIQRGGFERADQGVAGVGGVDDGVDPEAGGGVARVGLVVVGGFDRFEEFFVLLSRRLFCLRARVA